jgi:hypothetical protein
MTVVGVGLAVPEGVAVVVVGLAVAVVASVGIVV